MTAARSLALVAALAVATSPLAASAMRSGDVASDFSLPNLNGRGTTSLAQFKGKPVYVNFFASYCGPCNDEAPGIETLYKRYRAKGFVTIGVDSQEPASKGVDFAKLNHLTFPTVSDGDGSLSHTYGALGLPLHVFIDRHGKISTYRLGEMTPGEIDAAIAKIL